MQDHLMDYKKKVMIDLYNTSASNLYSSTASIASTATADHYYYDPSRSFIEDFTRRLATLEYDTDELSGKFESALSEALKQVGMADYKDRIQKEFKEVLVEEFRRIEKVVNKHYESLNERVNEYELRTIKKIEDLDKLIKDKQTILEKIDFLAKELGYQADMAQKSF